MSRSMRRSGRVGTRLLAVLSLLAAVAVVGVVVRAWQRDSKDDPVVTATTDAWNATGALSDALRALRPGATRAPARRLVGGTAQGVDRATRRVARLPALAAPASRRRLVLAALRADGAWLSAVGAVLDDPRSPRRAGLAKRAGRAAEAVAAIASDVPAARGTIGGTSRLLAATQQR